MASLLLEPHTLQTVTEEHTLRLAHRPITFTEFLNMTSEDDAAELINGMIENKMAAQSGS